MVNCSIVKFVCGLIVEVFLVWANGLKELQYVVWIQSAGLGRHAAGQVCVADVRYSLDIKIKENKKFINSGEFNLKDMLSNYFWNFYPLPCERTALQAWWSRCCPLPLQPDPPPLNRPSSTPQTPAWSEWEPASLHGNRTGEMQEKFNIMQCIKTAGYSLETGLYFIHIKATLKPKKFNLWA